MRRSTLRFVYNPEKSAQAAAQLVKLHAQPMDVGVLIKLLYLADRRALIDSGYTITGDSMVSMPHGPVLSRIYDCVKINDSPWARYITERQNHFVALIDSEPNDGELSNYEIGVLTQIYAQYGQLDWRAIRKLTHALPEYEDPDGSSWPIDPVDILKFEGKGDQEIGFIVREAMSFFAANQTIPQHGQAISS